MTSREAHLLAVYLLVIGAIFMAIRPAAKAAPSIPPPAAKSDPSSGAPPPQD